MKFKKNVLIIVITAITAMLFSFGCDLQQHNAHKGIFSYVENLDNSPKAVFNETWEVIRDQYLDDTMNHQDWARWKARYEDKIKTKEDAYVAIDTMLESLDDPYTRFLRPSDFQEQDRSIDAKLYGIGVHISQRKDNIIVVDVIESSPAQKAGLKANDKIIKVNGESVKGYDLKKVADMVRGKAGSTVKLTLQRGDEILTKNVTRAKINIKSVESKIINKNIGYIKISSFISIQTAKEMVQALKKTEKTKGLIVDLRGNFGGLLPNAVYIADMFIKEGTIVSIVDRHGEKDTIKASSYDNVLTSKPTIVLINGSSASASEILSGALKDHKRATLVGETTFGKGLVQEIHPLQDGSGLNITIAKYLTPNGTDINKKGIKPDYEVPLTFNDFVNNRDPQLAKAKIILTTEIADGK